MGCFDHFNPLIFDNSILWRYATINASAVNFWAKRALLQMKRAGPALTATVKRGRPSGAKGVIFEQARQVKFLAFFLVFSKWLILAKIPKNCIRKRMLSFQNCKMAFWTKIVYASVCFPEPKFSKNCIRKRTVSEILIVYASVYN